MSRYSHSAAYVSRPQNILVQSGVSFVSGLKNIQDEIDTLLSQTSELVSNRARELFEEECFDADAALSPGFTERRLEIMGTGKNTPFKNLHTPLFSPTPKLVVLKEHAKETSPQILWETCKTGGRSEFTFRKNMIILENIFSEYYQKIGKRIFAYLKEITVMVSRVAADAARPKPIQTHIHVSKPKKIVQKPKKIYTAEPTPAMKYQSKKRLEFAISTATTFALFAFLLVQADFIPESPRTVLESQVAGPAFAVATNTALAEIAPQENTVIDTPTSTEQTATTSARAPSQTFIVNNTTTAKAAAPTPRTASAGTMSSVSLTGTLPDRIIIDAINLNVPVGIPLSRDIAAIDAVLLKGAALYPGSGTLDEERNLLIMGHSSHLPVVRNQAYKAFNNIETLQSGNIIRVRSGSEEYTYRVTSVRRTPAAEALVNFNTGKRELTLVTCDNFGDKSDRYVVEADFIGKYNI